MRVLTMAFISFIIVGCASKEKKEQSVDNLATSQQKSFDRPTAPTYMTKPQDAATYVAIHFWDKFDFTDTSNCHSPVIEQAFVDFLAVLPHATKDNAYKAVRSLMTRAEVDIVMYNYFYTQAEHYLYEPNSPMRNDALFIPFLEQVMESQKVDDAHKIRPKHLLQLAYRNSVGTKASDFLFTIASGATGNLYSIKAEYIILLFYNPGCSECHRTIEMIKNSEPITKAIASGKLKVVAVYPDKDLKEWHEKKKEVPTTWINGYDKALDVKNKEIYDLKAIPTLYLLDKDKIVLYKDTSTAHLHEFFFKLINEQSTSL